MKHYTYTPSGTCSRKIDFDIDEAGKIHNVTFLGGCPGNTLGISTLAEGCDAAELAARLRGIDCRERGTSCPDQFAIAIEQALREA